MNCPACTHQLKPIPVGTFFVDICEGGCGGIWFDNQELQRMDDGDEPMDPALFRVNVNPTVHVDHSKRRNCPRCESIVMMRHFYSDKQQVEVDSCAGCGGYWLDAGELESIRTQYETETDRETAHEQDFAAVWQSATGSLREEMAEERATVEKFDRVLKFIRPSYYITGK